MIIATSHVTFLYTEKGSPSTDSTSPEVTEEQWVSRDQGHGIPYQPPAQVGDQSLGRQPGDLDLHRESHLSSFVPEAKRSKLEG